MLLGNLLEEQSLPNRPSSHEHKFKPVQLPYPEQLRKTSHVAKLKVNMLQNKFNLSRQSVITTPSVFPYIPIIIFQSTFYLLKL